MVFKLAGDRSFNGPVAGIVDAGRHFVGEETPFVREEFDGQDAYIFQGLENAAGDVFGSALDLRLK